MDIINKELWDTAKFSSVAAFVEVMGGQPIDRWKTNSQLHKNDRIPFIKLIRSGPRTLYAGLSTCLGYSCLFYFPSIYILENVWDKKYKKNDGYLDSLNKCLFVSSFISTGVSWFEGVKTDQQVNKLQNKNIFQITKKRYAQYGTTGIMPAYYSTFAREFCYCSGLLLLSPVIANKLETGNSYVNHFVGGGVAGLISQSISQPFDTIKTRQEKYKVTITDVIKYMRRNENWLVLWNGGLARCIRGIWSVSCMSLMHHCLQNYW